MSNNIIANRTLRFALFGDAIASGVTALLMAAGSGALSGIFELPQSLLLLAGLTLMPYSGFVLIVGRQPAPSKFAVRAIIWINLLWVAGSVLLLISGHVQPSWLGHLFTLAQAAAIFGFALAQVFGLWTSQKTAPARA